MVLSTRFGLMAGKDLTSVRFSVHRHVVSLSYTASLKNPITDLLARLQPQAVAFNGYGLTRNPARWIGTEAGVAPDPNWSTGTDDGPGDADSPVFCPSECDTTLQNQDRWFWVSQSNPIVEINEFVFFDDFRATKQRFVHCLN